MSEPVSQELFLFHMEQLSNSLGQINTKLTTQNGRLGVVETDVAVLKDRDSASKDNKARWGALIGVTLGVVQAVITYIYKAGTP